jgi:cytochrome c oxidase subunit 2
MPAMRIKQDAVPGLNTHVRFTPTKLGSYEVACAELCGLGHYRMNTQVHVVSEAEYQQWLDQHRRSEQ